MLGSTIEVPELDGKSLNREVFFDFDKGIKRSGVLYGITDYMLFARRFLDRYDSFINEENKTQNLISPEMMELLEQCKEWSAEGFCIPYASENSAEIYKNAFFKETGRTNMDLLTNFRFDNPYTDDEPYFYDIPSDSEKTIKQIKL